MSFDTLIMTAKLLCFAPIGFRMILGKEKKKKNNQLLFTWTFLLAIESLINQRFSSSNNSAFQHAHAHKQKSNILP